MVKRMQGNSVHKQPLWHRTTAAILVGGLASLGLTLTGRAMAASASVETMEGDRLSSASSPPLPTLTAMDETPGGVNPMSLESQDAFNSEATTMAQLPDILWDLLPPDLIPAEIIPDAEFLAFLQDTGELLQTVNDRRGQYALITASALANDNPRLTSWLGQVQESPIGAMALGGVELGDFADQLTTTLSERDRAMDAIALQSQQEQEAQAIDIDFEGLPDLRDRGPWNSVVETFEVSLPSDDNENESIAGADMAGDGMVDVYLPVPPTRETPGLSIEAANELAAAPVIVISHGVGGNRSQFARLASHLVSYGFVVVVPDHDTVSAASNTEASPSVTAQLTQLGERVFGDLDPREFVQRPLLVSAVLDELERLNTSDPMWMGRLDMNRVGMIGHSLGGYTSLALASGDLNQKQVKRTCKDDEVLATNLSLVLQCQAQELPRRLPSLEDERIKAVMALNPVASAVLGEKQLEDIDVPVMIVAGSHDAIAPMMSEQLPAFSWLTTPQKYLVTMVPGGHASVNLGSAEDSVGLSQLVTGPAQALGAEATQALSVAFMQAHLSTNESASGLSDQYLTSAYGSFLSDGDLELHLTTDLNLPE